MTIERNPIDDQMPATHHFEAVTADITLNIRDQIVRVVANPANGAVVVTLPSVAKAQGKFFSIMATDADAHNTVTVQDQDDSTDWNDITFDCPLERVLLYSDGQIWYICDRDFGNAYATQTPATGCPTTLATTAG